MFNDELQDNNKMQHESLSSSFNTFTTHRPLDTLPCPLLPRMPCTEVYVAMHESVHTSCSHSTHAPTSPVKTKHDEVKSPNNQVKPPYKTHTGITGVDVVGKPIHTGR